MELSFWIQQPLPRIIFEWLCAMGLLWIPQKLVGLICWLFTPDFTEGQKVQSTEDREVQTVSLSAPKAPTRRKIAVLINGDGMPASIIADVIERIGKLGDPIVRHIYGDFSRDPLRLCQDVLQQHFIEPENIIPPKPEFMFPPIDRTDQPIHDAMTIRAMDLMHTGLSSVICLVSSDNFERLALRIRKEGIQVHGFGDRYTPKAFRESCTKFYFFDVLGKPRPLKFSFSYPGFERIIRNPLPAPPPSDTPVSLAPTPERSPAPTAKTVLSAEPTFKHKYQRFLGPTYGGEFLPPTESLLSTPERSPIPPESLPSTPERSPIPPEQPPPRLVVGVPGQPPVNMQVNLLNQIPTPPVSLLYKPEGSPILPEQPPPQYLLPEQPVKVAERPIGLNVKYSLAKAFSVCPGYHDGGGCVNLANPGPELIKLLPDFNPHQYGYYGMLEVMFVSNIVELVKLDLNVNPPILLARLTLEWAKHLLEVAMQEAQMQKQ